VTSIGPITISPLAKTRFHDLMSAAYNCSDMIPSFRSNAGDEESGVDGGRVASRSDRDGRPVRYGQSPRVSFASAIRDSATT